MNDAGDVRNNDAEPVDEEEAVEVVGGGVDDGDDDGPSLCPIHNVTMPCALCN